MRTLIFCIYLLLMVPVWWAFLGGFAPVLAFIAWEAKARAKPDSTLTAIETWLVSMAMWLILWALWLICRWLGPLGLVLPVLVRAIQAA